MYCKNCGNQITSEGRFCESCGIATQLDGVSYQVVNPSAWQTPNTAPNAWPNSSQSSPAHREFSNIDPYQTQSNTNYYGNTRNKKKANPFMIVGIVALAFVVTVIGIIGYGLRGNSSNNSLNNNGNSDSNIGNSITNNENSSNSGNSNGNSGNSITSNGNNDGNIGNSITSNENNDSNIGNNITNNENNNNSGVLGDYTREVFSNNAFDYRTSSDNAVFEFSSDSTFECTYEDGETYRGIYEVYNGFMIGVKARDIENDPNVYNVYNAEGLADDIINVSALMMSTPELTLNTYLLYLEVYEMVKDGVSREIDILQPFVVQISDPSTNSGTAVNIMELMEGSFTMR